MSLKPDDLRPQRFPTPGHPQSLPPARDSLKWAWSSAVQFTRRLPSFSPSALSQPQVSHLTDRDMRLSGPCRRPVSGSLTLTLRRSLSGEWAVGSGPRCPEAGMVSGLGPVGYPAARPRTGGWGAVMGEEAQMTWPTWRGTGALRGSRLARTGPPDASPPQRLPSETHSSGCGMQARGSLSVEVTCSRNKPGSLQPGQAPGLGSCSCRGPPAIIALYGNARSHH